MSDNIPLGICREILLRLPAESLFRFRSVSKQWRKVIDDPSFVKAHTNIQISSNIIIRNSTGPPFYPLYYFNLEDLNFTNGPQTIPVIPLSLSRSGMSRLPALPVAACNGLLLTDWEIRNPLTNERLKVPQPNLNSKVEGYGLGYDCATGDYKVVVIDCNNDERLNQTLVYSLNPIDFFSLDSKYGVFLNGALHWVSNHGIIAFDVRTESYRQLALPGFKSKPESIQLDALSGCLFLSCCRLDVWVMNDYGGKEDSWMKLFSLNRRYYYGRGLRPVAYLKNEKRVLLQNHNVFLWFDVGSDSLKTVNIHGICRDSTISAQVFHGSLFRLHDNWGRVGAKRRAKKMADTKLTFCVRDFAKFDYRCARWTSTHDNCYRLDPNWYKTSSNDQIRASTSFNPDSAVTRTVPLDVCREIFLHLPAKSLIRFRAVCKSWWAVIDDPYFVKRHTNNQLSSKNIIIRNLSGHPFYPLYSFDLNSLNPTNNLQAIAITPLYSDLAHIILALPVVTCNGLMLVTPKHRKEPFEIWNPSTNERLEVPHGPFNPKAAITGFGYDYTCDDYKAVAINRRRRHRKYVQRTYVYSLRSDSWTKIGNFPCDEHCLGPQGPGVYLRGALHWLSDLCLNTMITVLELGTETYRQLGLPAPCRERRMYLFEEEMYLDVLDGCLIFTEYSLCYDIERFEVWVMKDYGDEDSWINLISIDERQPWGRCSTRDGYLRPVAYMKDNMQIFLQHDKHGFFIFDIGSGCMKKVGIHGLSGTRCLYAQLIPESMFRLHDNCGRRRRRIMTRTCKINASDSTE
ncbi:hypothetical protein CASFOL_034259 [Castilleja foliolosa]|uniref:F-box domain-containing protein n=1 Tax=Castilleja foliolosa TaxID=1961234 RepID=A0ABD3BWZ3_9LAMI